MDVEEAEAAEEGPRRAGRDEDLYVVKLLLAIM